MSFGRNSTTVTIWRNSRAEVDYFLVRRDMAVGVQDGLSLADPWLTVVELAKTKR